MYFMCRAGNVWQNHTLVPLTFLPACRSNCSNISSISSSSAWPVSNNPILLHTQRLFEILHDQDDHSTNLRCINVPSPKWKQRCAKSVLLSRCFRFIVYSSFQCLRIMKWYKRLNCSGFTAFFSPRYSYSLITIDILYFHLACGVGKKSELMHPIP